MLYHCEATPPSLLLGRGGTGQLPCATYLMVMELQIPAWLYEEMVAHAQAELPNECVGMLLGTSLGVASEYIPLVNELQSPTRFLTEARSMLRAEKRRRELGLEVLAIFHSHPTSEPTPSKYDIADHYSNGVMCLILSLVKGPKLAGWWIVGGEVSTGVVILTG